MNVALVDVGGGGGVSSNTNSSASSSVGNNRGTSSTSTTATLSSFAPTTSTAAATAAPTDYYQVLSSPPVPVFDHSFTLFLNDSLLVSIGGTWETKDLTNYYLSSPEASTITQSQPLSPFNSSSYSSVLFLNATSVFEWYLPPPSSQLPPHLYGLAGHSSVALADGNQIMILFGRNDPRAVAAATSNMSRSSSSGSLLTTTSTISTTTSKPSLVPPPPPPPYFTSTSDVWLFDASSFAWRPLLNQTGSLPPPRHHHVSLYNSSNSRIFVVGGVLNGSSSSLTPPITSLAGLGRIDRSLYYLDLPPLPPPPSPSSSSSSSSPTLTTSVQTPSSSSLPSSLLRAGSIRSNSSSSSSYWPASGNWTRIPPADQSIAQSGFAGSSAVMVNQYILLCFGTMDGAVQPNNLCSIFNTDTMSYDTPIYNTTLFPPSREGASMIYMNSTKEVVLFGGMNAYSNNFLNDVWVMDASSLPVISWYQLEDMRHNSTNSTNNYNGSINISSSSSSASLVLSPSSSDSSSNSSNPASSSGSGGGIGQSINVSSIPSARAFHGAVLFQESKILVWGGFSADAQPVSPNISVLDTQQWNWLPGTWQPKDGIIEGNHVIQFITYTSIAFGLAFFIGLATTAILMVGRMVQDRRQGAGGDLSSSKSSVAGAGSKTNLSSDEDDAGGGRMSSSANSTSNNNINKKQSRLLLNHAKSNNSINTVLSSSDTCSMVDMMMNRVDSSDTIHEVEEDDVLVRPSISSSSSSNGGVFVDVDDTFGDAVPLVELSRAITTTSATKASPMMGSLRESRSARCLRKTHLFHDLESSSSSLATPITTSSASVNIFDDEAAIEYSSLDVAAASSSSSYAQQPHYINNNNFPHYSNDLIDISDGSSYVFPTTMITNSHQQQQSHGNSGTLRSNYSSIAFSTNSHENSFLIQAQHISNSPLDHPPPPLPLASSRPFTSSLAPLQRSHHHHQEDAFAYPQGTLLSRRSIVSDDGYVSLNSFSN